MRSRRAFVLLAGLALAATQVVVAPSAQAAPGDLTELDCLANAGAAGCTDLLNDSLGQAASTITSPDGKHVYVGSQTAISAFDRDLNTGALTEANCWSNTGADGCAVLPIPVLDAVEQPGHLAGRHDGVRQQFRQCLRAGQCRGVRP